jgi:hypothetical protein
MSDESKDTVDNQNCEDVVNEAMDTQTTEVTDDTQTISSINSINKETVFAVDITSGQRQCSVIDNSRVSLDTQSYKQSDKRAVDAPLYIKTNWALRGYATKACSSCYVNMSRWSVKFSVGIHTNVRCVCIKCFPYLMCIKEPACIRLSASTDDSNLLSNGSLVYISIMRHDKLYKLQDIDVYDTDQLQQEYGYVKKNSKIALTSPITEKEWHKFYLEQKKELANMDYVFQNMFKNMLDYRDNIQGLYKKNESPVNRRLAPYMTDTTTETTKSISYEHLCRILNSRAMIAPVKL